MALRGILGFRNGIGSVACLAVVLGLMTACGGGSGTGGPEMSLQGKHSSFAGGSPTLEMTESETVALVNEVDRQITHTTDGAYYEVDPSTGAWQREEGFWTYTDDFDPHDILDSLPDGVTVLPVLEHKGIKLFKVTVDQTYTPEIEGGAPQRSISEGYYSYLEFSSFWAGKILDCHGSSVSSCDESSLGATVYVSSYTASSGQFSGNNPTGLGSAVWTGFMTGLDVNRFEAGTTRFVLGDARIDIDDLSDPDVDVAFTGIRELTSGTARPDMTWDNLALTNGGFSDGEFSIGGGPGVAVPSPPPGGNSPEPSQPEMQPETIRGTFYGPVQQEVGGVFDRNGITGSFGAKRQ